MLTDPEHVRREELVEIDRVYMHHIQVNSIARRDSIMTPIKPKRIRDRVYCRAGNQFLHLFLHLCRPNILTTIIPHGRHHNGTLVGLCPHAWHKLTNKSRYLLNILLILILCRWYHTWEAAPPWTTKYFRCDLLFPISRGERHAVLVSHLLIKKGNCNFIRIARSEWLKADISTKIMLRPDRFQGLVHLVPLTYAMDDSTSC